MSEAKLISPLLDGFLMGSSMGDHDGVACCPAMKEDSDHKYIVKIISVPASQKQLDALLLAGAYRRPEEAMKYFQEVADGIVAEAQCLQDLSKLEGFLPFEGWQVEPMDQHDVGCQVYLLGSYRRSLEKHMRRTMLTHLEAINLALDLCSALSTVRRAGYIYVDLKPTNIFLTEDGHCQIGDLGFVALDAFRYTALPEKYISAYTPPELKDPMADLNTTVDTYALGMVLYRIYNDGQLPKLPEDPAQSFPTPVSADYELADIILKALAPKPEDRWKDPQEMGQALAEYMQRNSVNQTPVTPPSTVIYDPADIIQPEPQEEVREPEPSAEESGEETAAEAPEAPEQTDPTVEQIEQDVLREMEEPPQDETMPTAEDAPAPEEACSITQEASTMVSQADELLAQEIPAGVEVPEFDESGDPFAAFLAGQEDWTPEPPQAEPEPEEFLSDPIYDDTHSKREKPPKKEHKALKIVFRVILILLILAGLGAGFWYGYVNYYLQTIDSMTLEGSQTGITVKVETDVDPSALTVNCVDPLGHALRQPLVGGMAQFLDLEPKQTYKIELEISGTHKLVGETSALFTTEDRTRIHAFNAVAGAEDGSVNINFTVDGPEPDEWTLICSAEGEKPREEIFSGHEVTVKDLTLGKTYTFQLETDDDMVVEGEQLREFTVSSVFTAENLRVSSNDGNGLVVAWETPEGADIQSWNVHCFNEEGYNEESVVTINQATFTGVDPTMSYIVEVTAEGMSQPVRITISANPVTITGFHVDESQPDQITVSWEFSGEAPEGGWLVSYGVDSNEAQNVVSSTEPSAVITPRIPGASYHIVIQTAQEASVFNNTYDYATPQAPEFSKFALDASHISAKLLKTPKNKDWNASMIKGSSYRDTFIPGDPVSMVLHADQDFYLTKEPISALYVLRDSQGRVLSKMTTREELNWNDLWMGGDYHDAELDLPVMPFNEGSYSVSVYFNNAFVASADFTIEKD